MIISRPQSLTFPSIAGDQTVVRACTWFGCVGKSLWFTHWSWPWC